MNYLKKILSGTTWHTWALLLLLLIGIFLRTYHFHDWLLFGDDQIRDAYVSSSVVAGESPLPLTGPFMSYSGDGAHSEENSFHLGPIYYYFQILSGKIFGNYPDKFAYPDVLFSILSIPLLYIFLKAYFSKNISLGVTAIYSVSAYFINYSHFAWNTNLIPFFVLLFLLSLFKLLEKNEKTSWTWVVSLGFALGVGFQLHAITMFLFSAVTFFVFLISMKRSLHAWKKWAVVFSIFLVLNVSQIINEAQTNFKNTKTLLSIVFTKNDPQRSVSSQDISLLNFQRDLNCQIEANFFLLSSYGKDQCLHSFITTPKNGFAITYFQNTEGKTLFTLLVTSLLFSFFGYFFLIHYHWREDDPAKKDFLRIILMYFVLGFFVMLPLSNNDITDFRYFTFGFFMPFLFLGFFLKFIAQKIGYLILVVPLSIVILSLPVASNAMTAIDYSHAFRVNNVTCSTLYETTLGELEPVVQYIASNSNGQHQIYLGQNSSQRIILDSLTYLLRQRGIDPIKFEDKSYTVSDDSPVFYVSCRVPRVLPTNTMSTANTNPFCQKIDPVYVYRLEN